MTAPAEDPRGGDVCKCPFGGCACDHTARPAGDRAQPTQELREAAAERRALAASQIECDIAEVLHQHVVWADALDFAAQLIAGPLAALLDTQAAVSRVEAVMAAWDRGQPVGGYLPHEIRRALDGTT